jgi:hypothetical protein
MQWRVVLALLAVAAVVILVLLKGKDHGERAEPRARPEQITAVERARERQAVRGDEDIEPGEVEEESEPYRGPLRVVAVPVETGQPALRDQTIPAPEGPNLVKGILQDPGGAPLPAQMIEIWQEGMRVERIASDERGRFEVVPPKGKPFDLAFPLRRYKGVVAGVQPGTKDLVFRTTREPYRRNVCIKVLFPDGTPAEGAIARIRWPRRAGRTDEHGVTWLEQLPAIELRIVADPPLPLAREDLMSSPPIVALPAGQEIVVTLATGKRITGTVFDPDGRPAARVYVYAATYRVQRQISTDDQGRFTVLLPGYAEGPWAIHAFYPPTGSSSETLQVRLGEDVTLHLQRKLPSRK